MNSKKIMIIAGEASGDLYGHHLAKAMKGLDPAIELVGMGGTKMAEAGVNILFDIEGLACIGFAEIIGKIPAFLQRLKKVHHYLNSHPPDLLVLIDFPEFNMRLAKLIKKTQKIPVAYYIPPTAWAWRKKRAQVIAKTVDKVISVFPFEAEVYKQAGANVEFVGHPLLDMVRAKLGKEQACQLFGLAPNQKIIGLLPGSRQREVKTLLPIMCEAAAKLLQVMPECQFIIPVASTLSEQDIAPYTTPSFPCTLIKANTYQAMSICDLLIVASGTATLEAACLGIPMVIVYKLNWVTWKLGRLLVSVNHIGLPNIVAGRQIVPELLQEKATSRAIFECVRGLLGDEGKLLGIKKGLLQVQQKLGSPGATKRAAEAALSLLY